MENKFIRYVYFLNPIEGKIATIDSIKRHVKYLKSIENNRQLVLCGPFKDNKGGMVILKVDNYDEALKLSKNDPFVIEGVRTFELRTWELSNKENNHMGFG